MCIKYVWNGFYQAKLVASCQYEKFLVYFAYIKVYFVQSEKVCLRLYYRVMENVNITKKCYFCCYKMLGFCERNLDLSATYRGRLGFCRDQENF